MARAADIGLMIWDSKSTGTLSNVLELISQRKKAVVYVNKEKNFLNVVDAQSFRALLRYMSTSAREKAEAKLRLQNAIAALENRQLRIFADTVASKIG